MNCFGTIVVLDVHQWHASCVTSTARLVVDDCLLYRRIHTVSDSNALQDDLTNLQVWEDTRQMAFGPEKYKVMRITNKRNPASIVYQADIGPLLFPISAQYQILISVHHRFCKVHLISGRHTFRYQANIGLIYNRHRTNINGLRAPVLGVITRKKCDFLGPYPSFFGSTNLYDYVINQIQLNSQYNIQLLLD